MGLLYLICLLLILIESPSLATAGERISEQMPPPPSAAAAGVSVFKPSIAIIVGVITTVFSITFLLLLYIKHCKRTTTFSTNSRNHPMLSRENSGINRKVIESLPMFRFSSLRGQKDGLECAVCLNKFDAEEVLRLLPKCKHAFHVECVDTWLDAHSTCPLCRYRVDPEDVLLVDHHEGRSSGGGSGSSRGVHNHGEQSNTPRNSDIERVKEYVNRRISGRHSSAGERGSALEIIVENPDHGRISLDSRRKTVKSSSEKWRRDLKPPSPEVPTRRSLQDGEKLYRKDGQLPLQVDKHRLEHRIIISGDGDAAVEEDARRRRWSDVEAAEFLYLRSEMILGGGEEEEEGSERRVINARSVSEITGMSRYRISNIRERKEEGFVKRWLDMDWISHHRQKPAVNSATSSSSSPAIVV